MAKPAPIGDQLHPELAQRIYGVLRDLISLGYRPRLSSGYRNLAEQQKKREAGLSEVSFGYHNVTDQLGRPSSMAVHVIDQNLGYNAPKGHKYWNDLERVASNHGLYTGNQWKKPWDPTHVQLYDKSLLKYIRRGKELPFPGGLRMVNEMGERGLPSGVSSSRPGLGGFDEAASRLRFMDAVQQHGKLELHTTPNLADSLNMARPSQAAFGDLGASGLPSGVSSSRPGLGGFDEAASRLRFMDAVQQHGKLELHTTPNLADSLNMARTQFQFPAPSLASRALGR